MSGPTSGKAILHIEWTNQHGCGDGDLNCNIVLQYMCQPDISPGDDRKDKKRNGKSHFISEAPLHMIIGKNHDQPTILRNIKQNTIRKQTSREIQYSD